MEEKLYSLVETLPSWARKPVNRGLAIFPLQKLIRFCLVGGAGGLIGLGILYLCKGIFGLHYLTAGAISCLSTYIFVYLSNSKFTFGHLPGIKGFGKFIVGNLGTASVGFGLYALFIEVFDIWYMLASILSTISITLVNFLIARYWVWKKKPPV